MGSFDAKFLFTHIPVELDVDCARGVISDDSDWAARTTLQQGSFCMLLDFCLRATSFTFNGTVYNQLCGTAMGSPISATVADIVMEHVETTALTTTPYTIKFWKRFVDDVFAIAKKTEFPGVLEHLNTIHTSISFTMDEEQNGGLPFLDVWVKRGPGGKLLTSVYRKPTHTGSYLHFSSHHPHSSHVAVVRTLSARADSHTQSAVDKEAEMAHITNALMECGYPRNFIKQHSVSPIPPTTPPGEISTPIGFCSIPYIRGLTERISRVMRQHRIRVHATSYNTTRNIVSRPKDVTAKEDRSHLIYRIPCLDCDSCYVGETQRRLKDRLKEHRTAVFKGDTTTSAVAEHAHSAQHNIDWANTAVLGNGNNWRTRKLKEACFIGLSDNTMNRDVGFSFPTPYLQLLKCADRFTTANDGRVPAQRDSDLCATTNSPGVSM